MAKSQMSKVFEEESIDVKIDWDWVKFYLAEPRPQLRVSNQLLGREESACKAINCEHMSLSLHFSIISLQTEDKQEWLH